MFFGEYEYRIDEKGRAPLPPKFRAAFADGIVLVPGAEKCILAYTPSEWKELAGDLTTSPLPTSKMRKLSRALFASAFELSLDAQGRIAIPATLRQHAGITADVIVAGNNAYLELWDKKTWQREKAESLAQAWQTIETLEKR